jgi:hypothetical protein
MRDWKHVSIDPYIGVHDGEMAASQPRPGGPTHRGPFTPTEHGLSLSHITEWRKLRDARSCPVVGRHHEWGSKATTTALAKRVQCVLRASTSTRARYQEQQEGRPSDVDAEP